MAIVWTLIVGLIVGAIARALMPGVQAMSWPMTALLGVGGSILGGLVSTFIWRSQDGRFHPAGWILSIIGAIVILWGYNHYMAQ